MSEFAGHEPSPISLRRARVEKGIAAVVCAGVLVGIVKHVPDVSGVFDGLLGPDPTIPGQEVENMSPAELDAEGFVIRDFDTGDSLSAIAREYTPAGEDWRANNDQLREQLGSIDPGQIPDGTDLVVPATTIPPAER